jgi:pSer/pThr/pTyr-binding forkhead associated (FHA) protein
MTSMVGPKITIMSGVEDGRIYEFAKTPIMLGRHSDDDICIPYDVRISRHHARINQEGGSYFIEDVGPEGKSSNNGTYVRNKKIATKTAISAGEMILLGSVWIKFD